ncbi:diaminopimelate epimerase family protein, partial [Striga asiatica]
VKVDMGEPIFKALDVPTRLAPNKVHFVAKARFDVDGSIWNVTCIMSVQKPARYTFSSQLFQPKLARNLSITLCTLPEQTLSLFKFSLQVTLKCAFGRVGQAQSKDIHSERDCSFAGNASQLSVLLFIFAEGIASVVLDTLVMNKRQGMLSVGVQETAGDGRQYSRAMLFWHFKRPLRLTLWVYGHIFKAFNFNESLKS